MYTWIICLSIYLFMPIYPNLENYPRDGAQDPGGLRLGSPDTSAPRRIFWGRNKTRV